MGSSPASEPALRPLRALRYDQSRVRLADVFVPPYDVISPADRERYAAISEYSAVHLVLPDSPSRAGRLFYDWRQAGILVPGRRAGALVARAGLRRPRRGRGQPVGLPLGGAALGLLGGARAPARADPRLGQGRAARAHPGRCGEPLARVRPLRRPVEHPARCAAPARDRRAGDAGEGLRRHDPPLLARDRRGRDRRRPGGDGRPRHRHRRRPPPLRDGPRLPRRAPRPRRRSRR